MSIAGTSPTENMNRRIAARVENNPRVKKNIPIIVPLME